MADTSRISNLCGSMNSMYFVDPFKPLDSRYIRVEGIGQVQPSHLNDSYGDQTFNEQIVVSSYGAWLLLLASMVTAAFVPPWLLVDVKAQGFTRNGWRFFICSFYLLPFVMFEQRSKKSQSESFRNQLTKQKLKPIFISTINFCIWLLCLIYACRHTSMNHAVSLCCLRFFISSALKMKQGLTVHQFEIAGCLLCLIGVTLCIADSITTPQSFGPGALRYQGVQPWKRVIFGDGLAIVGSFVAVYLDQNHQVPDMPKFTYLFLYNVFLSLNSITFGYFFGGSTFSLDPKFGVFGLFTYDNFVSLMYVSVVLGLSLILANVLVSEIFNLAILDMAGSVQLIICCIIWHVLKLEHMLAMTCLGYAFITPGTILIIGGQGALNNIDHRLNFELYRPTQINTSMRTGIRPTLKGSWSIQMQRPQQNPRQTEKDKSKLIENMPFEMIIEEKQNQERYHKYS